MAATNIHYAAAVLDITVRADFCYGMEARELRASQALGEGRGEVGIEERAFVAWGALVDDGQKISKVLKQNLNLDLVQNPILNLKTAKIKLAATGGLMLDMRCGAIEALAEVSTRRCAGSSGS
jgi:hypothetical protein